MKVYLVYVHFADENPQTEYYGASCVKGHLAEDAKDAREDARNYRKTWGIDWPCDWPTAHVRAFEVKGKVGLGRVVYAVNVFRRDESADSISAKIRVFATRKEADTYYGNVLLQCVKKDGPIVKANDRKGHYEHALGTIDYYLNIEVLTLK